MVKMINPARLIFVLFMWLMAVGSIDTFYELTNVIRNKAVAAHKKGTFSLKRWNEKLVGPSR